VADIGSTTLLEGIIDTYDSWGPLLRDGSRRMFVAISDGDSNLTAATFDSALEALDESLSSYVFSAYVADHTPVLPSDPCFGIGEVEGAQYIALQTQTGGVVGNLCEQNISPFFDDLGNLY
jgi:hypothetical protein